MTMTEIERLQMALAETEKMWRKERDEKNALLQLITKHFDNCEYVVIERKPCKNQFSDCDQYHD